MADDAPTSPSSPTDSPSPSGPSSPPKPPPVSLEDCDRSRRPDNFDTRAVYLCLQRKKKDKQVRRTILRGDLGNILTCGCVCHRVATELPGSHSSPLTMSWIQKRKVATDVVIGEHDRGLVAELQYYIPTASGFASFKSTCYAIVQKGLEEKGTIHTRPGRFVPGGMICQPGQPAHGGEYFRWGDFIGCACDIDGQPLEGWNTDELMMLYHITRKDRPGFRFVRWVTDVPRIELPGSSPIFHGPFLCIPQLPKTNEMDVCIVYPVLWKYFTDRR